MPLNENTRPLTGKHIGNQLEFSGVRDRNQPKASGALHLTATDEVTKAKASSKAASRIREASTNLLGCRRILREQPRGVGVFSLAAFEAENKGKT